jgi:hypothetical protein
MDKEIYMHFKDRFQQYFNELRQEEKNNPFLIWTESDLQSYLYHKLVADSKVDEKYSINNRPVLSSINPEKAYQGIGKSVKHFHQPDILITPQKNLKVEQRKDKPRTVKRLELIRKNDSIVVEIKFVQDTYDSIGRKSKSILGELQRDYEKRKNEGHKWIILVFAEKGDKSNLTSNDIGKFPYKEALITHKP